MTTLIRDLGPLLKPRSLALVGASDRSQVAVSLWQSLNASGFGGELFLVNPSRKEVFGALCYPSLASLPQRVDLCLIVVAEGAALSVVQDCVAAGVPAALLFSLFRSGVDGQARTDLRSYLENAPVAVCGSGTFGAVVPSARFTAVISGQPTLRAGKIALICQSGGILNSIASNLDAAGVGIEAAVATGGEDQLGAAHFIDYFVESAQPLAVGCVLEQIQDPELFRRACEKAAAKNIAIVVLYIGRSDRGKEAALAHSGSMATDSRILDALLEQVGAISVSNLTQMVSTLAALNQLEGRPLSPNSAMVNISGGESGLMADLAERHGLCLPSLRPDTHAALRSILKTPDFEYHNPLDAAAGSRVVLADSNIYRECIETVAKDPDIDMVLVRRLNRPGSSEALAGLETNLEKPVFFYSRSAYDGDQYGEERFVFCDIEEAVSGLGRIAQWSQYLAKYRSVQPDLKAHPQVPSVLDTAGKRTLMENEVFPLLAAHGMSTPPFVVAGRDGMLPEAADEWTGPFIVKILSETILHRRSVGGVIRDLPNLVEVRRAIFDLFKRFDDQISGVVVEPMLRPDFELMLGAKRDRMGLAIMLAFGGTFVEDFDTMALCLSPIDSLQAERLIERSKVAAALRRLAATDSRVAVERLRELILRFDDLCRGFGSTLQEFDLNPLGFYVKEGMFRALDAKIVVAGARNADS